MLTTYKFKELTWIDAEMPTKEEISELMTKYNLDPEVAEDLHSPTPHPRIDLYKDSIFLILYFPALKHSHTKESNQEIDFVLGKNFIITVRYDTVDALHKFSKIFEVNSILEKENFGNHAGFIFFHMLTKIYRSLAHELEYIHDRLTEIEQKIFSGREHEVVINLSRVSKDLITFKEALGSHQEILEIFDFAAKKFYGESYGYLSEAIIKEYHKLLNAAKNVKEFLVELRETNDSLLNTKQNESMKIFTLLALFTFPLSLIVALLDMDTKYRPIIGSEYDFIVVLVILIVVVAGMFAFFKYKKWI